MRGSQRPEVLPHRRRRDDDEKCVSNGVNGHPPASDGGRRCHTRRALAGQGLGQRAVGPLRIAVCAPLLARARSPSARAVRAHQARLRCRAEASGSGARRAFPRQGTAAQGGTGGVGRRRTDVVALLALLSSCCWRFGRAAAGCQGAVDSCL
eukprot:scaffold1369_cov396-Prasinococcus_capsulatus_cf.AAC.2